MNNAPLIISGSGRSGTTWVLDAIAESNGLRTIFEPLNPGVVPEAGGFANRYIREDEHRPDLESFMDKTFSGNLKSLWANYRIRPDRLSIKCNNPGTLIFNYKLLVSHYFKYRKTSRHKGLIVKFIRANLMLGWIFRMYQPKILLLMRHPGAVAASKMQLGGANWSHESVLRVYMKDEKLFSDYLFNFRDILFKRLSPVAAHTIIWCIENMIPLQRAQKKNYCLVFYEDLILNRHLEWRKIIDFLGLSRIPDREMLIRPSQQVSTEMRNKTFDDQQIGRWMKSFDQSQLIELDEMLKIFDVPFYSAYDPLPTQINPIWGQNANQRR
jgi:Sulfotransferase family